jgi:hypothetical protein
MRVATLLAVGLLALVPSLARTDEVTTPLVPANIQVPAGNKAFFVGHAVGNPELHLLAVPKPAHTCGDVSRLRLRLCTLHAAGHPVRRR